LLTDVEYEIKIKRIAKTIVVSRTLQVWESVSSGTKPKVPREATDGKTLKNRINRYFFRKCQNNIKSHLRQFTW